MALDTGFVVAVLEGIEGTLDEVIERLDNAELKASLDVDLLKQTLRQRTMQSSDVARQLKRIVVRRQAAEQTLKEGGLWKHTADVVRNGLEDDGGHAGGLDVDRLKAQWDELARVQEKVRIRLLRGTEADINVSPETYVARLHYRTAIVDECPFYECRVCEQRCIVARSFTSVEGLMDLNGKVGEGLSRIPNVRHHAIVCIVERSPHKSISKE